MTIPDPVSQTQHSRQTRDAYDQLAAVWSATTDDGPFNGFLERPSLRALVPAGLVGAFARAGFVVDDVAEPQPSPEALERFPSELADIVGVPNFIVYRLRLAG